MAQQSVRTRRFRNGQVVRYNPVARAMDEFRGVIRESIQSEYARAPTPVFGTQTIMVEVIFVVPRPLSHYIGNCRTGNRLRAGAPKYPTKRPDVDNYVKFFLDAGTGVLWQDDSTIVDIRARKLYHRACPETGFTYYCVMALNNVLDAGNSENTTV